MFIAIHEVAINRGLQQACEQVEAIRLVLESMHPYVIEESYVIKFFL